MCTKATVARRAMRWLVSSAASQNPQYTYEGKVTTWSAGDYPPISIHWVINPGHLHAVSRRGAFPGRLDRCCAIPRNDGTVKLANLSNIRRTADHLPHSYSSPAKPAPNSCFLFLIKSTSAIQPLIVASPRMKSFLSSISLAPKTMTDHKFL